MFHCMCVIRTDIRTPTLLLADNSRPEYGVVTGNLGPAVGAVGRGCHEDCTQAAHVSCRLGTLQIEEITDKRVTVHRGLLVGGGRYVPVSVAMTSQEGEIL